MKTSSIKSPQPPNIFGVRIPLCLAFSVAVSAAATKLMYPTIVKFSDHLDAISRREDGSLMTAFEWLATVNKAKSEKENQ